MTIVAISVNMAIQYTAVALLLLAAVGYLVIKIYRRRKSGADRSCNCGCSSCQLKNSCNSPDINTGSKPSKKRARP